MKTKRDRSLSLLRTSAPWLSCAALLAMTSCGTDEQLNPVPLTTTSTSDPDGGAGGDAGAALRSLVDRKLFGTMPLGNRFHDPGFTMLDGSGWMPIDYTYEVINQIARAHLARTPGGQPALRLWPPPSHPEATVVGEAKGAAGPIVVSVWFGRADGQDPAIDSGATLIGLFLDGTPSGVDIALDTDPAPITLDGMRWQRLSTQLDDGPVGFSYFRVVNRGDYPLVLTSPILVPVDAQRDLASSHQGRRRPLRKAEARALTAATERKRRQLGLPDQPKR
ncbi:MAG: hypothetical protein DRI90_11620 [Deltaproteobacteria bacterium]|nr:MAG: hypothetical protein DRI90_11620 [Deltaproteobacteria bacterium]